MTLKNLDKKKEFVRGKAIVGIDPANDKHQAFILDENGIAVGKSFSFSNNSKGIRERLWLQLRRRLPSEKISPDHLIFAIEASIDFWQVLADYLNRKGYQVVLISPLTTKKTRSLPSYDFSRTDPKDSRMIAENTAKGYFHAYTNHSDSIKAMKTLSLTYNKLRHDLSANHLRLRSQIKRIFPELLKVLPLDTDTALYLLSNNLHPQDFIDLNVTETVKGMLKASQNQHGMKTLQKIQEMATDSIGIPKDEEEKLADRLTIDSFLIMINTLKRQLKEISKSLIKLAKQTSWFETLTSVKGISELTASLFIAEVQDLSKYKHFKQIQKLAGLNLRLNTSGNGRHYYRINKIGNRRLRWVIYIMTRETAKYTPEVRIRYLRRQLQKSNYTKNITACTSQLIQLIWSLIKDQRRYEFREETQIVMWELEHLYNQKKNRKKKQDSKKSVLV